MENKDRMSFEQALDGLEKSAEALKKEGTTLEDALLCYERGMKYYERCSEILKDAKQRIQVYDKNRDELLDF